ncbi:hypothetical protein [Providencia alcalifaciens]|uniref:hypothetical protein n=1 Tax=Providencia alcalifaciens TaxID=126385 RepID=UPI001CC7F8C7|nr:hypothetical protein [Providencia alcalifaciens]CAG9412956.1 hypothetical protein NVI2019_GHJFPKLH_00940 [Providencia alcalifaciens]
MKKFGLIIFITIFGFSANANNQVELLFHVGVGADEQYRIGGTIQNNTSLVIEHAAITYLILDEKCYPKSAQTATFNQLPQHQAFEFSIPVSGTLYGYKILSFTAYDSMGSEYKAEDTTLKILQEREEDRKNTCQKLR